MASPPLPVLPCPGKPSVPLLEVGIDLTIYAERLTVPQWETALSIYRTYAPPQVWTKYVASPQLGFRKLPARDYIKPPLSDPNTFPFLATVRDRTVRGWRTEFRIWDGKLQDSWSACFYRLAHQAEEPEFCFYRFLFPWDTPPALVAELTTKLGQQIEYLSGHAGYCFLYDPYFKETAFTQIYRWAKRYWAIDVEDMNAVLTSMHDGIKTISWLTLIGAKFLAEPQVQANRQALATVPGGSLQPCGTGVLLLLGNGPIRGDRHRPEPELAAYYQAGTLLESVLLKAVDKFAGPFDEDDRTLDWIHRFAVPKNW
jgi:hypothetical protein